MTHRTTLAGESLTVEERSLMSSTNACPDCGGKLLGGPSGGSSQNVLCERCCSEFNVCLPFFADRISDAGPRDAGNRRNLYRNPYR